MYISYLMFYTSVCGCKYLEIVTKTKGKNLLFRKQFFPPRTYDILKGGKMENDRVASNESTIFLDYKTEFLPFQNIPKNLDPSYKMALDLWDCLGSVKLI